MTQVQHLYTIRQFSDRHEAFSEGSLRWLVFNATSNGFRDAFVRIGRRVLVDEDSFFQIVRQQNDLPVQDGR